MSFMLTTEQFVNRTKSVTRRMGWEHLRPGERIRGVRKAMGLKRGESIEPLGVILVKSVRREPLIALWEDLQYGELECQLEGFPHLSPRQFIDMFCASHKGCRPGDPVTRIEFEYVNDEVK